MPELTPSQTIGPFFGFSLPYPTGPYIAPVGAPGTIRLHGTVIDGAGAPVPDALVETWQADADGRRIAVPGSLRRDVTPFEFTGFGRSASDDDGHWFVSTVKPGPTGPRTAPFVAIVVFARGLTTHLFTRCYFGDEEQANASDAVLGRIDADRRSSLVAEKDGERSYRFDIRLQGEGETVFFDYDRTL
ncbi:MAG TPA: protocatechuate 3,4-dioxygenase subunit alpha [Rhodoglobus sp.]|nr:protocatechuate 3,4-dioxygenase subunit alpha [Rhodoglobus sp.]